MDAPQRPGPSVERGRALIAAAIVAASLVLYWGMPGDGPRYQIAATSSAVVRLDTDSGEMIACGAQGCGLIQEPERAKTAKLLGLGGWNAQQALPPPASSPART